MSLGRRRPSKARLNLEQLESREVLALTPTAVEQVFLERLNDARANPAAYGNSIGLNLAGVAPSQPLAFDTRLIEAARLHSQDMNSRGFFSHTGSNGSSPGSRMSAAGYPIQGWAESIAAGYSTPEAALSGLIIDSGVPSLGHRRHLLAMDGVYQAQREVGIGIVQNGTGPYRHYYTIDTSYRSDTRPFLTGVVYNDTNRNNVYDAGEGVANATITVAGVGTVTTWSSGGYSLQLSPGTYSVTVGGVATPVTRTITVGASNYRFNVNASAVPIDVNWTGGGLTLPSTITTDAAFTFTRTYNIAGGAVGANFTVTYYASTDATLGNADDVLLGTETVSAAADKTVGLHTGTTAPLRLLRTGSYYLFARLDTGDALAETDEGNNVFRSAQAVSVEGNLNVLDDGEPGFSTTGGWTPFGGQGYRNDVTFAAAGTGSAQATWSATGLTPGRYRVSATWSTHANRATNAPYTVLDGATTLATAAVNQELAPNDLSDQGVAWEDLGTVNLTGTTLVVRLTNLANEYVIADGVRIERVGGLPAGPEIQVLDGAADVPDNTGSVSFGTVNAGATVSKTFTVKNLGTTNLTLGPALDVPPGFVLVSGFGTTTLAPGASTTFTVRLDTTSAGSVGGQIHFDTNDADENPFDFAVSGTVTAVTILDDGEPGFSTTGGWTPFSGQGYRNDVTFAAAGTGSAQATWTFANLGPGRYRVSATWSTHANRATNAPFTVLDGTVPLATVTVNQELAPNDLVEGGVAWEDLGTVNLTGATLVVRLSNAANEYVIADAIRIEKVG